MAPIVPPEYKWNFLHLLWTAGNWFWWRSLDWSSYWYSSFWYIFRFFFSHCRERVRLVQKGSKYWHGTWRWRVNGDWIILVFLLCRLCWLSLSVSHLGLSTLTISPMMLEQINWGKSDLWWFKLPPWHFKRRYAHVMHVPCSRVTSKSLQARTALLAA